MSELFEKSIRVLELPRVLELLERHAVSAEAKERAKRLSPSTELDEVRRLLDETDAARELIVRKGSPSFGGVKPVAEAVGRAQRGGMLNTRELLDIAGLLSNARRVREYLPDDAEPTVLNKLFGALRANRYLEEKITTAIISEDEIADAASNYHRQRDYLKLTAFADLIHIEDTCDTNHHRQQHQEPGLA